MEAISGMEDSEEKQQLENILMYADYPHIISLSGYNQLLEAAGLPQISLEKGESRGLHGRNVCQRGRAEDYG